MVLMPLASVEAIVNAARGGDRLVVEPAWLKVVFLFKVFCPELLDSLTRLVLVTWPTTSDSSFQSSSKCTWPSLPSQQEDC